eukprot:TRINITY_DN42_c0_g2_i5.p1 TRINITY_DN42_c0_g2~~TRINITY_DN42_c0_g2_i5.p1  ORF type:complete len:101 (-),score=9.30 TRINITY_DN42_c0_g2_i5:29-331(-)
MSTRRDLVITKNMVGLDLDVYSGKFLATIDIRSTMVGHRIGAYAFTKITGKGTRQKRHKMALRKLKLKKMAAQKQAVKKIVKSKVLVKKKKKKKKKSTLR